MPGQSLLFKNIGGIYTSSFLDGLNETLRESKVEQVNWESVFQKTRSLTQKLAAVFSHQQVPQAVGLNRISYGGSSPQVVSEGKPQDNLTGEHFALGIPSSSSNNSNLWYIILLCPGKRFLRLRKDFSCNRDSQVM